MSRVTNRDRALIFAGILFLWLLVPVPLGLMFIGVVGESLLWPTFGQVGWFVPLLWLTAFYGPLVLMAYVALGAARARRPNTNEANLDA